MLMHFIYAFHYIYTDGRHLLGRALIYVKYQKKSINSLIFIQYVHSGFHMERQEPKISKETLFSFMEFMSAFLKDCYFNSFFEEKNPKLWNLIKCENGCRSELLLITYCLCQNEKILNFAWKAKLILSDKAINMPQTIAPSNLCFELRRHFVTLN